MSFEFPSLERQKELTALLFGEAEEGGAVFKSEEESHKFAELNAQEAETYFHLYVEDAARSYLYWNFYGGVAVSPSSILSNTTNVVAPENGGNTEEVAQVANTPAATIKKPKSKDIDELAERIYREIVRSWKYDPFLLKICRLVDCSVETIRSIVDGVNNDMKRNKPVAYKSLAVSAQLVNALASVFAFTPGRLLKSEIKYSDLLNIGMNPQSAAITFMRFRAHQDFWRPVLGKVEPIPPLTKALVFGYSNRRFAKCSIPNKNKKKKKKMFSKSKDNMYVLVDKGRTRTTVNK